MAQRAATCVITLVVVALGLGPRGALAHGPCGCLTPASGPPGTTVTTRGAYKVVLNPDRTDLGIGPESLWQDHQPGVTPTMVYRKSYRYSDLPLTRRVRFRVPAVPPGRYLVSIYDGGEGGAHYTWEYFAVTERSSTDATANASEASTPPRGQAADVSRRTAVTIGVVALLLGLLLGALAARGRIRAASQCAGPAIGLRQLRAFLPHSRRLSLLARIAIPRPASRGRTSRRSRRVRSCPRPAARSASAEALD